MSKAVLKENIFNSMTEYNNFENISVSCQDYQATGRGSEEERKLKNTYTHIYKSE